MAKPVIKKGEPLEKQLWAAADKLRKNVDAAEYKHIVLGLIFLRYISSSFEALYERLKKDGISDLEDRDRYTAENVFFVPELARWSYLQDNATKDEIGKYVNSAMDAIEKDKGNSSLKGILPQVYAQAKLDPISLGGLINLISNIDIGRTKESSADTFGRVFEYFLGEFAREEGKNGGQFYTPRSIVELLVSMLEPYKGRVFDPCCGSGGLFVQSERFVKEHQGNVDNLSLFGQESNETTWKLAKMNLAVRGIDSSQIKYNNNGSFLKDEHKELKADYVIANPPFNDKDWEGELLRDDVRWAYGVPPVGNANFAWIQHFLHHLTPEGGLAGFVLSKGALTTQASGEGEIRRKMIEDGLVDCIVNLPAKLFLNTQIPASLWFMRRGKVYRKNEILFIDARNLGHLVNRRTKELSDKDIAQISDTYHSWKKEDNGYQDMAGFCKTATIEEVAAMDYILTPGRYVGLEDSEDDFDFEKRFAELHKELEGQIAQEAQLNKRIFENLKRVKGQGDE